MEKESLTTVAGAATATTGAGDQGKSHGARLQLVSAVLIFGTIGVFTRNIPLASGEIALYRGILAIICVAAFLVISRQGWPKNITKSDVLWLLLSGAAIGINWVLLFQAYANTTVSLATISYYFAPTLVTIASAMLFREHLGPKQIVCFIMATLGLVLGIVHTGFAYCIYFSSLPRIPGQTVAVLSYLDPLLAVILSVVVLQEPITLVQCIGGAMILGFALWNEIK